MAADSFDNSPVFTAFNFGVEIQLPNVDGVSQPLCQASFAECDGLEISFDIKTIREGGNNGRQIRLTGPSVFGQLTLKRGMTRKSFDLWRWVVAVQRNPALRADTTVVIFDSPAGKQTEQARFVLSRCVPMKLKAPPLNAKDGLVAIEELQVAYESLELRSLDSGRRE
jgi:phage tail-like protein